LPENGRSARGVTTGFDLNWVAAMIFMVIIGGIGTLEGPILGTVIYYGIRELLTSAFAPIGKLVPDHPRQHCRGHNAGRAPGYLALCSRSLRHQVVENLAQTAGRHRSLNNDLPNQT